MIVTFDYKPGNYLKSNNTTYQIIRKTLLLISFIYILILLFYPINNILFYICNTFIICSFSVLISYLYFKFSKNSKKVLYIIGNTYSLINGFLISILLPMNIHLIITLFLMLILFLLKLFINKLFKIRLNYVIMILFCSYTYISINNIEANNLLLNNGINWFLVLITIIVATFLIINDCIKWRITIIYFIGLLLCLLLEFILKNENIVFCVDNIFSLFNIIYGLLVINDFKSTSVIPFTQYLYAFICSVMMFISIKINNYSLAFFTIVLFNVFGSFFDDIYINIKNKN